MDPFPPTQRESLILPSGRIPPKLSQASLVSDPKQEGYRDGYFHAKRPSEKKSNKSLPDLPSLLIVPGTPVSVSINVQGSETVSESPGSAERSWVSPHCLTSAWLPLHLPRRNGSRGQPLASPSPPPPPPPAPKPGFTPHSLSSHTCNLTQPQPPTLELPRTPSSVEQRWRNGCGLLQEGKGKSQPSFRPAGGGRPRCPPPPLGAPQAHTCTQASVPLNAHDHRGRGEALGGTSTFSTLLPSLRLGPGKTASLSQGLVTTWKDSHLEPSCLWARRSPRTSSARTALGASTQAPTQGVLRNSRPCIGSPRRRSPPAALCEGAGAALAGRCRAASVLGKPQPSVSSSLTKTL
ncbi:uncharacterized protein LOC116599229 isoform X3 [Mustela erminea]|nr:uncharacterized protein LOC116599229 isoform X2 [Mustela erminea]XP_032214887.1 uncharacterized protein LOC116599229 isoform X3 [Mustela erminea]XP_032214888.1 uncharacterized protein LOC116599229 isoform X3 [Mustela erminea]